MRTFLVQALIRTSIALLFLTTTSASAQTIAGSWIPNGVPVEAAPNNEALLAIPIPDNSGGCYVVWRSQPVGGGVVTVRCLRLTSMGAPDPNWPVDGLEVGGDFGRLQAVSDRSGGIYVAFANSSSDVRVIRLTSSGQPAVGWTAAGAAIGNRDFVSLHSTADGSIWGVFAFTFRNCPIGHDFCDTLVQVGARHFTAGGVNVTGPFPGGFFSVNDAVRVNRIVASSSDNELAIFYETYSTQSGYVQRIAWSPVGNLERSAVVRSGLVPDYSMYLDSSSDGSTYVTSGSHETSVITKLKGSPIWAGDWTYPTGVYGGAYPLGVLTNPDGSLISHSMVFETNPSPHIVDSFVQRVLPNGSTDPAWPLQGVSTRGPALLYQGERVLESDGRGGCLAAWEDLRTGESDIFALPISASGQIPVGWIRSGTAICILPNAQTLPRVTHDAAGNLFVCWIDRRNGSLDVYAQKLGTDLPVATRVQRATGHWTGSRVELAWEFGGDLPTALQVERSLDSVEWLSLGEPLHSGPSLWTAVDVSSPSGAVVSYRLREPLGAIPGTEISVATSGGLPFAIQRLSPSPADGQVTMSLAIPITGTVEIQVHDIQGRLLTSRYETLQAGVHRLAMNEPRALSPGVYLVSVRYHGEVRLARMLVTH